MIHSINGNYVFNKSNAMQRQNVTSPITSTNVVPFKKANISGDRLALALQAQTMIPIAKSVSFGQALFDKLADVTAQVSVCKDEKRGRSGESVGTKTNVNGIITEFAHELKKADDALKTTIPLSKDAEARTQLKRIDAQNILYEMAVRKPKVNLLESVDERPSHTIGVIMNPEDGIAEEVSILNTKGKLMAVVEDGHNILLTDSGRISKKSENLRVIGKKQGREFVPFVPQNVPVVRKLTPMPSIGVGARLVVGMEDGRFNPEIVHSIEEFEKKLSSGEIVLPQFRARKGAKNLQIAMLAGGFGSRAEYANASAGAIFKNEEDGAQSTKGVFRIPTGLTPMETTLVSLHMAGIIDCSANKFGIGKNIFFYQNKSGVNKGNGGFTLDLQKRTIKPTESCEFIFPNDSISRMPEAIGEVSDIMNEGNTAIAMIAKKVPAKNAVKTFGIMELAEENRINKFAEKPPTLESIETSFIDENGDCLVNTFQFAVSKEAFKALSLVEPYFSSALQGKETRDWSKQLVPTIMVLSQFDTPKEMRENLQKVSGEKDNPNFINFLEGVPDEILIEAKTKLNGQKVVAVPTSEPWTDGGQADALYDVSIAIAKGDFAVTDFERKHVLDSINPRTGLVAMTPQQKAEIEQDYNISGEVIVVPKAAKVEEGILDKYADFITINPPSKPISV